MVSLLSFFSKKRPKAGSSSSAGGTSTPDERRTPTRPITPPSPNHKRSTQRDRSTRTKAAISNSFRVEAGRSRTSMDSAAAATAARRLRSAAPASVASTPAPQINIALPFEARASDPSGDASLGLDAVGRTPVLTAAERRALDAQRYTPADLQAAWEWLGPEFTQRGAERVGIMLPRRFLASKDRQRQLGTLFALARRPELADMFPSLVGQYPSSLGSDEQQTADEWKARLLAVARDTPNPIDLAEVLKTMLRRLGNSSRPIVDPAVYVRFVQQEHAASYPRVAYGTMLMPQLDDVVNGLLSAVFEVVAAIALHSERNAMSAGRLCHLFGWWLLGAVPDGTADWNGLYKAYGLAGQRTEHLFYARLRWQTTQQKMPRRLVQLILSYPFGESSASSEHLPMPPASTFPRKVLHVALGTSASPLPTGTDPAKLLGDAIIAKLDDEASAPQWEALRTRDGRPVTLEEVLSEDSLAFLGELAQAKGIEVASPLSSPFDLEEDEQKYHPFSPTSERITTHRRRSQSWGDRSHSWADGPSTHEQTQTRPGMSVSPSLGAVAESPAGSTRSKGGVGQQESTTDMGSSAPPAQWSDFAISGFGESSDRVRDLSLSLRKPRDSAIAAAPEKARFRISSGTPSSTYVVASEEVVEVDDAFLHFVEDGQLDQVASSSWPRFALVQLATPTSGSNDVAANWLLVTVKRRDVKRALSVEEPLPDLRTMESRPTASVSDSNLSRFGSFGFSTFTKNFRRRSSLLGGLGGMHNTTPARSGRQILGPVAESKQKHQSKDSAISNAPTEYTIGEMGEIVKIPSSYELAERAKGGPAPESVLTSTSTSDWIYLAEGGAHAVFRYRGADSSLQGKVIRLVKLATAGEPSMDLRNAWKEKLVHELVPPGLLAEVTSVPINEQWGRGVVTPTEMLRPTARREDNKGMALADIIDYTIPAQIMPDLLGDVAPDETVLAIEIKPKWGFLPARENVSPASAAAIKSQINRFRLHQHYKGDGESAYCPLELYSGDHTRMRHALDTLWEQWHTSSGEKNNLRVYVDGKRILPPDAGRIPTADGTLASTSDFLLPLLEETHVLDHLKRLQSTLDASDISTLAAEFATAHPNVQPFDPEHVPEPTVAELTEFVTQYNANSDSRAWTPRQRQIAYGLSATFKDCSIIVRAVVRPIDGGYELDRPKSSVAVIDTDLKPLTRMQKWHELDEKIWRHWEETRGVPQEQEGVALDKAAPATTAAPVVSRSKVDSEVTREVSEEASKDATETSKDVADTVPAETGGSRAALGGAGVLAALGLGAASAGIHRSTSSSSSIPSVEEANHALRKVVTPEPSPTKAVPTTQATDAVKEAPAVDAEPSVGEAAPATAAAAAADVSGLTAPDETAATTATSHPTEGGPVLDSQLATSHGPAPADLGEAAPAQRAQSVTETPAAAAVSSATDAAAPATISVPTASENIDTPAATSAGPTSDDAVASPTDAEPIAREVLNDSSNLAAPATSTASLEPALSVTPDAEGVSRDPIASATTPTAPVGAEAVAASGAPEGEAEAEPVVKAAMEPAVPSVSVADAAAAEPVSTPAVDAGEDTAVTAPALETELAPAASALDTTAKQSDTVAATSAPNVNSPLSSSFEARPGPSPLADDKKTGLAGLGIAGAAAVGAVTAATRSTSQSSLSGLTSEGKHKHRGRISSLFHRKTSGKSDIEATVPTDADHALSSTTSLVSPKSPLSDSARPPLAEKHSDSSSGFAARFRKGKRTSGGAAATIKAQAKGVDKVPTPADELHDPFAKDVVEEDQVVVTDATLQVPDGGPETAGLAVVEASVRPDSTGGSVVAKSDAGGSQAGKSDTLASPPATPSGLSAGPAATPDSGKSKSTSPEVTKRLSSRSLHSISRKTSRSSRSNLPRLSAFGDDLNRSSPRLSATSDTPSSPSMVPTKAPDSPTDTAFRKADTSFPRLSAFGPPGSAAAPLDFDQKTPAEVAKAVGAEGHVAEAAASVSDAPPVNSLAAAAPIVTANLTQVKAEVTSPSSVVAEPPTPAVERQLDTPTAAAPEAGLVSGAAATTSTLATEVLAATADDVPPVAKAEDSTSDSAPVTTETAAATPNLAPLAAGAGLGGLVSAGVAALATASSGESFVSNTSDVSNYEARRKRSFAPSPSPGLGSGAIGSDAEPFAADLSGVREEYEPALETTPLAPSPADEITPPFTAPLDIEARDAPAGELAAAPAAEDEVAFSPPGKEAAPSSPVQALAADASALRLDDDEHKTVAPPAHVEHYKHAELPPIPPSTSGSNLDVEEASALSPTPGISPFVTAPVSPSVTPQQDEPKVDVAEAESDIPDFPIHSPTPPMMHAATFPRSVSNKSFGARSISATSAGTASSVMSAQPGPNAPAYVPLAGEAEGTASTRAARPSFGTTDFERPRTLRNLAPALPTSADTLEKTAE